MITKDINKAKSILLKNGLVAIPTETVYGIAGNAFSEEAIKKIFELKKRPLFNPLIVHLKAASCIYDVAMDIPATGLKLIEKFWPGPLTLILKKQKHISDLITAGKDTVAVRVPNHPLTLALLNELDFPLTAPSANPFGSISPTNAQHVINYFGGKIEAVLDGGQCENGLESTIVGFENEEPILYRHGAICIEEIEKVTGPINYHTINDTSPSAPGMLTRHYAPKTETFCSDDVNSSIHLFKGKKIGLLVFQKEIENDKITKQEILSKNGDFDEAAKNLYAAMHRLDEFNLDVLIIEKLPDLGLGKTINDKLVRAAKK